MNSRAKLGAVALTAATVLMIPPAFGAAGPDNPVSGIQVFPTNRGGACLGNDCGYSGPSFYYSFESLECDSTGLGNPLPSNGAGRRFGSFGTGAQEFVDTERAQSFQTHMDWVVRWARGDFANTPMPFGSAETLALRLDDCLISYRLEDYAACSEVQFAPIDYLLLGGSYSAVFRAPTIQELFFGDSAYPSQGASASTSGAAGAYDGVVKTDDRRSIGTVYEPDWAQGLDVSLDYFDIEIEDAIDILGGGVDNILDICFDEIQRGDSPRCQELDSLNSLGLRGYTDPNKAGLGWQSQFQYKFFPTENFGIDVFPGVGSGYADIGAAADPLQSDSESNHPDSPNWDAFLRVGAGLFGLPGAQSPEFDSRGLTLGLRRFDYGSLNIETDGGQPPFDLGPLTTQQITLGQTTFTSVTFPEELRSVAQGTLATVGITEWQVNGCRVILVPTDPNFRRTGRHGGGSWGQPEDDQWAIKRVGFTADDTSAWNEMPDDASPVVVAVIDTGLDWHHLDISAENIWKNEDEIPDNGIDDDDNGYVDDIIGWDFFGKHNRPWDFDGHGTVVAGIIAATQDNDAGIAGINPNAKIMVLKGVNNFGNTRASFLAEAIVYAADNGAQIINLSVGGPHTSRMEQAAINYAHEKGVLVVAASGNDGVELDDFGPGGNDNVLTVGATYYDDRAAAFSNYGDSVDIVAPGVDVLSLRARYTDTNFRPANADYVIGTNYVGDDKRYIHVSGTSFSTPIVAATASMLMSKDPQLTAADVRQILLETAQDIEFPGKDKYAGYGMLDARAALSVGSDISVIADITGVELVQIEDAEFIKVVGTIDATAMKRAWMQIGPGENPGGYKYVGQKRKYPIRDGTLGTIPVRDFAGNDLWQIVINVEDRSGIVRRDAYPVRIN